MNTAEKKRIARVKAKGNGICIQCLHRKAITGQTKCGVCSEYQQIYKEKKRVLSMLAWKRKAEELGREVERLRQILGSA